MTILHREMRTDFEDFTPVPWSDVCDGDEIYVSGKFEGMPVAYGPFKISNYEERKLTSTHGTITHSQEDLLFRKIKLIQHKFLKVGDVISNFWGDEGEIIQIKESRGYSFTVTLTKPTLKKTIIYPDERPNEYVYHPVGYRMVWPGANIKGVRKECR